MARLTDEQRKNLSKNLAFLNNQRSYTNSYVSKCADIRPRTYDSYLYGECGASQKNLEKLARFYETTIDILLSDNIGETEAVLGKALRDYQMSLEERMLSEDEKIEKILEANCGQGFAAFIKMLKIYGFSISYQYSVSDDVLDAEAERFLGKNGKQVLKDQFTRKFTASGSFDIPSEMKEAIERLKNLYEYQTFDEKDKAQDNNIMADSRFQKQVFICKYYAGEIKDICNYEDSRLSVRITENTEIKSIKDLRSLKVIDDTQISETEIPINDLIRIFNDMIDNLYDEFFEN